MIKAKVHYTFKDKKSFEKKVIPYIFGGGIFYNDLNYSLDNGEFSVIINAENFSQLITSTTGMLRYSPGTILEKIEVIYTEKSNYKTCNLCGKKPILGIIIKPSFSFKESIAKEIIKSANNSKLDFVKDDDASEYSLEEAKIIKTLSKDIAYFQKISDSNKLVSNFSMVVPWVDGWKLLQEMSRKSISVSHCASLSPQISWYSHIIFSRLAGASLIIVADPLFDKNFNLKDALEAASKKIEGIETARLILSGGINPERIRKLLNKIDEKDYCYIGFAVGSWIISNSKDISDNVQILKDLFDNYEKKSEKGLKNKNGKYISNC